MQFMATLMVRPDAEGAVLRRLLIPETRRAWDLVQQGTIRSMWQLPPGDRLPGPAGVVMVLECADELDARRQVDSLPLVEHELVDVNITALVPFDGFRALFARKV